MSEVPLTPTPLTRDATAQMFLPAYAAVFGELPDRNRAEMLLALVWLENANGQSIIQFNWGNLSTKASDGVAYWRPTWFDLAKVEAMEDGPKKARLLMLHQRMLNNAAPSAFRAFADHQSGVRAWLSLLKQPRMAPVLQAASSGDPVKFAHAIFSSKYCPDPECRDAGASYGKLRDQIRAAGYFEDLKKKSPVGVPVELACSFWLWGQLLQRSTSGIGSGLGGGRPLWGDL